MSFINSLATGVLMGLASLVASAFSRAKEEDGPGFALFKEVFYQTEVAMAIVGLEGKPLYLNSAAEQFFGYSEKEIQKMPFPEFTHREDIDIDVELFSEIISGERDRYLMRKRWISKSNDIIWGLLSCHAIREDDELLAVLAIVKPLTSKPDAGIEKAVQRVSDDLRSELRQMKKEEGGFVITALKELRKTKKLGAVITALFFLLLSFWLFITGGASDIIEAIFKN